MEELLESREIIISSEKLGAFCGVNPAQVRKDLTFFGEFGVRGVGYNIGNLLHHIQKILATDKEWHLCIVGLGNLGHALVENDNMRKRGYNFVAAFDIDPLKIGTKLDCGLTIEPNSRISVLVPKLNIEIGVIATPPLMAQGVSNLLMSAGVRGIYNLVPVQVRTDACCVVENVDFTVKLENLAYHIGKIN